MSATSTSPLAKNPLVILWSGFGAWALLVGLPGLTAGLSVSVTRLVAAGGAGLLLSIAVAASWDRYLVQTRTYGGIVLAGAATASFCLLVGATSHVERRNAERLSLMELPAWPPQAFERISEIESSKTARLAARIAYENFGIRPGYRGDNGVLVVFEPTKEERDSHARRVAQQREVDSIIEEFSAGIAGFGAVPTLYLGSFPVGTTLYLLWMARRRGRSQAQPTLP